MWLATGAAGTAAAATAGVMALGSAPATAAYSVARHDGTLSVSVYNATGVAGANSALKKLKARVVVVPVREDCPGIELIPAADPAPHPAVWVSTSLDSHGHRAVSVKIKGTIPAGDTMILAFSGSPQAGSVGAGGIISGPVPICVSLPGPPDGGAPASSSVTPPG